MHRAIFVGCCTAVAALPCRGDGVTVEGSAGVAFAPEIDAPIVPTLSLRLGYGWKNFSTAARGILILGPSASERPGGSNHDSSGFQAAAALGEISVYSDEALVVGGIRVAAGGGSLVGVNCNCEEVPVLHGPFAPLVLASAFASVRTSPRVRVGLELAALHFWGLERGTSPFGGPQTDLELWAGLLLLSLQWNR